MEELRREYCEGLGDDLASLESMVGRLDHPDVPVQVREIAHKLRGSGGAYGFAAISAAGAMTEDARPYELADRLDDLLLAIRMARRQYGLG